MNFAYCLHIVLVIGKYTNIARIFPPWRIFPGRNFILGKIISMKGALDIPAQFKKRSEIKFKKQVL